MLVLGIKQQDLTKTFGVKTRGSVGHYLRGRRTPSLDQIVALANCLRMSLDELLTGRHGPDTVQVASDEPKPGYIRLPQYEAVSGGEGAVVFGEVVRELDVAIEWASKNLPRDTSRIKIVGVVGESMSPEINDGDVLFVDTAVTSFVATGIYVINWNGMSLVKRLVPDLTKRGGLIIQSNHPKHGPQYVEQGEFDHLHIGGRVIAWWTLKRF